MHNSIERLKLMYNLFIHYKDCCRFISGTPGDYDPWLKSCHAITNATTF